METNGLRPMVFAKAKAEEGRARPIAQAVAPVCPSLRAC